MKSRVLRTLVLLAALACLGGAGYFVWKSDAEASVTRAAAQTFEQQARVATMGLADLRAAFQAYVADGQAPAVWQKSAATTLQSTGASVGALREAARSPEAQGALEEAVELIASLAKSDQRAREYLASGQRLSASDVVFGEATPATLKAAGAVDAARVHETGAASREMDATRWQQVYALAGAAGFVVIALLLLTPVPRRLAVAPEMEIEPEAERPSGAGLGLSSSPRASAAPPSPPATPTEMARRELAEIDALTARLTDSGPGAPARPPGIDLAEAADVCTALARLQEPKELPALLERAAAVLGAGGIVVWMPDGAQGALRPALAFGFSPLAITRMGSIPLDAENATALAYRAVSTQVVPPEAGSGGAVAAPLVTAEGCSGVMAAELTKASRPEEVHAVATIIAAQLATLISPGQAAGGQTP